MEPVTLGAISIILLVVLMAVGIPIGVTMMLLGFLGVLILINPSAALMKMAVIPFSFVSSYDFAVIPMFMLMANLILVSGLGTDLYRIASKWFGRRNGGLAIATTVACAGFAAISGSGLATSLTIGQTAMPEMKKYKYDTAFSAAVICASGTIGLMIPPSTALMVYGIVTGTSIRSLFIGGFLPGLTEALFYIVLILILTKRKPAIGPRSEKSSFREKMTSLKQGIDIIVLILFVFLGMLFGLFTPTEAGAMGAAGAFIITVVRRRLDWKKFWKAIKDTIKVSGMYFFILIGAQMFMYLTSITTLPRLAAEWVGGLDVAPMVIMLIMMGIYMILGCFMSGNAIMMLTIPIFFPIVLNLGFNPIWFGILLTRVSEIGQLTPPVGLGVYSIQAILPEKVPIHRIFKYTAYFVGADVLHLVLLLFVPAVTLYLPTLFAG
ncbi:MAG: TRAP transporter large permease [Spirochaetales bacterium]|nr:TRAP transporter large permease [Spirochaetales bacterium]